MDTRLARRQAERVRRVGRRAGHSRAISWLARAGFAARGVLYVLIGVIAVQIALDSSHRQADSRGAVRLAAATPFGLVLLWIMAVGFAGLTLWRLSEAVWGAHGPNGHKATKRLVSLGKALIYGFVTFGVLKYALGLGAPASSDKQSRDLTAGALRHPGGQYLVAAVGVVIVVVGLYLAYQAYQTRFLRDMRLGSASPEVRKTVTVLGQVGGIARGVVFVTVGSFLIVAAVDTAPGKAKGIDSALRALADTPFGPWLLSLVAVGLVLFGGYSCCEARWRAV